MRRTTTDVPGPGQRAARRAIRIVNALADRGVRVSIHWVPGHAEVFGNELADAVAREEATRQRGSGSKTSEGIPLVEVSPSWLKKERTEKAIREWRDEILVRNRGRKTFSIPREGIKPSIPRPEEPCLPLLSVELGSCYDRPLLKGEVRMDQLRPVLVVWDGPANERALVQGVHGVGKGDQADVEDDWGG